MHLVVKQAWRFGATALVLAATAFVDPAAGQSHARDEGASETLGVMHAVLRFRLYSLDDATPVDVCSVYEQAGRPAEFPRGLRPEMRELLGLLSGVAAVTDPPVCPPSEAVEPAPKIVKFERVSVGDTMATVRMNVRRGDQSHTEDYLVKRAVLGGWIAVEVRIWGTLYAPPPRRRSP